MTRMNDIKPMAVTQNECSKTVYQDRHGNNVLEDDQEVDQGIDGLNKFWSQRLVYSLKKTSVCTQSFNLP
jgi:hypothetical protein